MPAGDIPNTGLVTGESSREIALSILRSSRMEESRANGKRVGTIVLNHNISPEEAPSSTICEFNKNIITVMTVKMKGKFFFIF